MADTEVNLSILISWVHCIHVYEIANANHSESDNLCFQFQSQSIKKHLPNQTYSFHLCLDTLEEMVAKLN